LDDVRTDKEVNADPNCCIEGTPEAQKKTEAYLATLTKCGTLIERYNTLVAEYSRMNAPEDSYEYKGFVESKRAALTAERIAPLEEKQQLARAALERKTLDLEREQIDLAQKNRELVQKAERTAKAILSHKERIESLQAKAQATASANKQLEDEVKKLQEAVASVNTLTPLIEQNNEKLTAMGTQGKALEKQQSDLEATSKNEIEKETQEINSIVAKMLTEGKAQARADLDKTLDELNAVLSSAAGAKPQKGIAK